MKKIFKPIFVILGLLLVGVGGLFVFNSYAFNAHYRFLPYRHEVLVEQFLNALITHDTATLETFSGDCWAHVRDDVDALIPLPDHVEVKAHNFFLTETNHADEDVLSLVVQFYQPDVDPFGTWSASYTLETQVNGRFIPWQYLCAVTSFESNFSDFPISFSDRSRYLFYSTPLSGEQGIDVMIYDYETQTPSLLKHFNEPTDGISTIEWIDGERGLEVSFYVTDYDPVRGIYFFDHYMYRLADDAERPWVPSAYFGDLELQPECNPIYCMPILEE